MTLIICLLLILLLTIIICVVNVATYREINRTIAEVQKLIDGPP